MEISKGWSLKDQNVHQNFEKITQTHVRCQIEQYFNHNLNTVFGLKIQIVLDLGVLKIPATIRLKEIDVNQDCNGGFDLNIFIFNVPTGQKSKSKF